MRKGIKAIAAISSFCLLGAFVGGCQNPSTTSSASHDESHRRHFIGNWKTVQPDGKIVYTSLNSDGSATTTEDPTKKGSWKVVDKQAHIQWNDGSVSIIVKDGLNFRKDNFAVGASLNGKPTSSFPAVNVDANK
jgi:hypothetical protein